MAIGDKIKFYRKKSGLTQSQLAELIGVSSQAISKWETGAGCPDLSVVVPLAIALGVSTDELLDYKDGINLNTVKAEWNSAAAAYELFNNSPDSYSYTIEWPCIQELLPDLCGKSVLDFGCGTGIFTFLLEKYYVQNSRHRPFGGDAQNRRFKGEGEKIPRAVYTRRCRKARKLF